MAVDVHERQNLPRAQGSGHRESRHLRFPTVPARAFPGRKAGVSGLVLLSLNSLPFPVPNFRHVLAVFGDVVFVFEELVADVLLGVGGRRSQLRQPVQHVAKQMKPVEVVQHHHVERRGRRAFLLEAAHVLEWGQSTTLHSLFHWLSFWLSALFLWRCSPNLFTV